jgi:hypothetical protein
MMADIGKAYGAWTIVGRQGRGAWCWCLCGTTRVAVEALEASESVGCGCRLTPRKMPPDDRGISERTLSDFALASRVHRGGSVRS